MILAINVLGWREKCILCRTNGPLRTAEVAHDDLAALQDSLVRGGMTGIPVMQFGTHCTYRVEVFERPDTSTVTDLMREMLTMIGTPLTSIMSFHFGSRAVAAGTTKPLEAPSTPPAGDPAVTKKSIDDLRETLDAAVASMHTDAAALDEIATRSNLPADKATLIQQLAAELRTKTEGAAKAASSARTALD